MRGASVEGGSKWIAPDFHGGNEPLQVQAVYTSMDICYIQASQTTQNLAECRRLWDAVGKIYNHNLVIVK